VCFERLGLLTRFGFGHAIRYDPEIAGWAEVNADLIIVSVKADMAVI
jgi:hypothetical protein